MDTLCLWFDREFCNVFVRVRFTFEINELIQCLGLQFRVFF